MLKFTSNDAAECYFRTQIETASKNKAIYILHERCIYFLGKTRFAASEKRFLLNKAQNILARLQSSLKLGDSVSQSLFYLYDYCYLCLERGNDQDITNTIDVIDILQDTFRELLKRP